MADLYAFVRSLWLVWLILLFLAADVIVRRVFRIRAGGGGVAELQTVTRSYAGAAPAAKP